MLLFVATFGYTVLVRPLGLRRWNCLILVSFFSLVSLLALLFSHETAGGFLSASTFGLPFALPALSLSWHMASSLKYGDDESRGPSQQSERTP